MPIPDYSVMISIVQSLMMLPSNGHLTTNIIPRYMGKLCDALGLGFCRLTALSASGQFHQILGTATLGGPDPSFLNLVSALSRAKEDYPPDTFLDPFSPPSEGINEATYEQGDEPSSRESARQRQEGPHQIHGENPAPCTPYPSLVDIVSRGTTADPLISLVNEDGSNIGSLPSDWKPLVLIHGMRSIICIPIFSAPPPPSAMADNSYPLFQSSNLLGCLTFASTHPLEWKSQGWFSGLSLLIAWTSGILSTHRSMRMLEFCEQVESSSSIDEMAAAFVHVFPSPSTQDDLMQVEVRLALVYSKLNQATIYVHSSEQPTLSQKSSIREAGHQASYQSIITSSGFSPANSGNMYRYPSLKSATVLSLDYTISEEDGDGEGDDEKEEVIVPKASTSPARSADTLPVDTKDARYTSVVSQEASFGPSKKTFSVLSSQPQLLTRRSSLSKTSLNDAMPNPSLSLSPHPAMSQTPAPPARKPRSVVTLAGALSAGYIQIGDGNTPETGEGPASSSGSQRGRDADRSSRYTGKDGRSSFVGWRSSHAERVKLTQRVELPTDGTMIMSSLEAGDMMVVKDSIGKKLLPPDLSLEDYPCPIGTQILLLPLVYKSRPMGCVYVFIRQGARSVRLQLPSYMKRAMFSSTSFIQSVLWLLLHLVHE